MIQRDSEIELRIENLALDGKAIARLPLGLPASGKAQGQAGTHEGGQARQDGLVCFVRGGVPGDVVRVRVTKIKRNFAEADVVDVISPSPHRVEPRCKYFGTCGGCKWQHVAYGMQLEQKQQYVVDAFERIGGFSGISITPIVGAESPYFYRNKMEFSFSRQRWLSTDELRRKEVGEFGLGLHVPGRYDKVVDLDECWLPVRPAGSNKEGGQPEVSNGILNTVRVFCKERGLSVYSTKTHEGYLRHLVIRLSHRTGDVMVNLVTTTDEPEIIQELTKRLSQHYPQVTTVVNNITSRKSMVAIGDTEKAYLGPGYITERVGKYSFRVSANSFFQTNTEQAERLYTIAKSMAEFSPGDVVFDLYCGTGTIAIFISDTVQRVVGIDVVQSAIEDARLNARLNAVQNCEFVLGDLKEKLTKDTSWLSTRPDTVIVDPPRSGLHPKVIREVALLEPKRVVYISCNPATQARDAKMLCESGYEIIALQPVDMFPHTTHVENVAVFRKT